MRPSTGSARVQAGGRPPRASFCSAGRYGSQRSQRIGSAATARVASAPLRRPAPTTRNAGAAPVRAGPCRAPGVSCSVAAKSCAPRRESPPGRGRRAHAAGRRDRRTGRDVPADGPGNTRNWPLPALTPTRPWSAVRRPPRAHRPATARSAAASSVSIDALASSCASRPARRACARSCSRITRCRAVSRISRRFSRAASMLDAGGSFGCDDRQRRRRARPRARDRSRRQRSGLVVVLSSPHGRIAAAARVSLTLVRAIQVRNLTLGPVRER